MPERENLLRLLLLAGLDRLRTQSRSSRRWGLVLLGFADFLVASYLTLGHSILLFKRRDSRSLQRNSKEIDHTFRMEAAINGETRDWWNLDQSLENLVELSGIEPLTSCMPCKRSPS